MRKNRSLIVALIVFAAVLALCLVACDKVQEIMLEAPADVYYDGQYLTWNKVDADYYTVSINGGEAQRVNSTTYAYTSSETDFDVTVSSVKGEASKSVSKTFHKLAAIEQLNVHNDGTVWWDAVAGASAYEVQVNGQVVGQVTDVTYDGLSAGNNRVKVRPIVSGDNSFWSLWSDEKRVNVYAAPSNIKYDGTVITWSGNAPSYEVCINNDVNVVTKPSFEYISNNVDFDVEIKAIGDYTTTFDSSVTSESFKYLSPVRDLSVENGNLVWGEVENAKGYKVHIYEDGTTGNVYTVSGTEFTALAAGKSFNVEVLPYNDEGNYFSTWSAPKTVRILETPVVTWETALNPDGVATNNLTWQVVTGAIDYMVEFTDPEGKTTLSATANKIEFGNAFSMVGEYKIRVMAMAADGGVSYDSKYTKDIKVIRLPAPTAPKSNFIVSDASDLSEGMTINFNQVGGAYGYRLYKDGEPVQSVASNVSSFTVNNIVDGGNLAGSEIEYSVQSVGQTPSQSANANNGFTVTLDSLTDSSLKAEVNVLPAPAWNDDKTQNIAGTTLRWNAVGGAVNGYTVRYNSSKVAVNDGTSVPLTEILTTAGSYEVAICARGDGAGTLASNYNPAIDVQRLATPTGLHVLSENDGTLTFTNYAIDNATYGGYRVTVSSETTTRTYESLTNFYAAISTAGSTVYVVYVGNRWVENTYYLESLPSTAKTFIRLAAPTFSENSLSTQEYLTWNAPVNISGYSPEYTIFADKIANPNERDRSFDLSFLEAGEHIFSIQAVGDGQTYITSEPSVEIKFTKLETPQIKVTGDGYRWNSVQNATSYQLHIGNTLKYSVNHGTGGQYGYMPEYGDVGTYTVKLEAVGNGSASLSAESINTISSDALTFEQKVTKLSAPTLSARYSDSAYVSNGRIIADITTASTLQSGYNILRRADGTMPAISYQFEVGTSLISDDGTCVEVTINSPGTYAVKAKAVGGIFGVVDSVSVTSDGVSPADTVFHTTSESSNTSTIYLLGVPTRGNLTANAGNGYISWGLVSNSLGYEYYIVADGVAIRGSADSPESASGSSAVIEQYKQYNSITIYVRAKGNGTTHISSAWSDGYTYSVG